MKHLFRTMLWSLLGGLCLYFAASHSRAKAAERGFSGRWQRNEVSSESAGGEVERVVGKPGTEGAGGKAFSVFNRDTLFENADRIALSAALWDYVRRLHVLELEQTERELRVLLAGAEFGIFYLDGKPHRRQLRNGVQVEATAVLESGAISVRQKASDGSVIRERYALLGDSDQMEVRFELTSELLNQPIAFATLYDRVVKH